MGFSIPSIGNLVSSAASGIGNLTGLSAPKPAPAPAAPTTPAAQKPVDSFEAAGSKPATCGGNTTAGDQCLPTWGKTSGGGGGGVGVNPSRGGQ